MYIRPLRKWLRRNPIKALFIAVLAFLLIQLPPWIADVWSLGSDRPLATVLREQLYGLQVQAFSISWITTPIGLAVLFAIIVLLLTEKREKEVQPTETQQNQNVGSLNAEHARVVEGLKNRIQELERDRGTLESQAEERIFVDVTPEYITGLFKGLTHAQGSKLTAVYVGKWLKASGVVNDVHSYGENMLVVYIVPEVNSNFIISARFTKRKWIDRVEMLKGGDHVTVLGKMWGINETIINILYFPAF